nr:hypothetical protein [Bacteroides ovatus]
MKIRSLILIFGCLLVYVACSNQLDHEQTTVVQAWDEFPHPQDSIRAKVWWFHGETETPREGITADLETYKRAGVDRWLITIM